LQQSTGNRHNAEAGEIGSTDEVPPDPLWLAAAAKAERCRAERQNVRKQVDRLISIIKEFQVRHPTRSTSIPPQTRYPDQFRWRGDTRHRSEERRVRQRKDGAVDADSKRERGNRSDCE
jgi:hypothetical protein